MLPISDIPAVKRRVGQKGRALQPVDRFQFRGLLAHEGGEFLQVCARAHVLAENAMAADRAGQTAAENLQITARASSLTNLFDKLAPDLLTAVTRAEEPWADDGLQANNEFLPLFLQSGHSAAEFGMRDASHH
jgi:hypothetical protein